MLPSRPFYMIRHGQSEANEANLTAGGGLDSPLTRLGEQQAQTLSEYIHKLEIKPSQIFASPMIRAHKTATLINEKLEISHTVVKHLHEMHFGDWEGVPWDDIVPFLDQGQIAPNGESNEVFSLRIKNCITETLTQCHEDEVPMLVAHGGLFYAIGLMYGHDINHVQNCHLHLFEPHDECLPFPWKVWQFDIENDNLVKKTAPFCATQTDPATKKAS